MERLSFCNGRLGICAIDGNVMITVDNMAANINQVSSILGLEESKVEEFLFRNDEGKHELNPIKIHTDGTNGNIRLICLVGFAEKHKKMEVI